MTASTTVAMSPVELRSFDNRVDWAEQAAQLIAKALRREIVEKDKASLAVAGGATPTPIFDRLNSIDLQWRKVHVCPTDERWVPRDHPQSNEALIRNRLLGGSPEPAIYHSLYEAAPKPSDAKAVVQRRIDEMPRPFAAVLLGMGEDGHFASLFPGAVGLDSALQPDGTDELLAVDEAQSGYPRMSLTLSALLRAQIIILAVTGAKKREIISRAMTGESELPVSALLNQRKRSVSIYWSE